VSISDMPAANRIGSAMIASGGSPPAMAVLPAIAIRPTCLAVPKPRPNSSPTGYICAHPNVQRRDRKQVVLGDLVRLVRTKSSKVAPANGLWRGRSAT